MVYAVLIAGIVLIIYGFMGIKKDQELNLKEKDDIGGFKELLSDNLILNRLDFLEQKMDEIKEILKKEEKSVPIQHDISNTQLNIHQEVMDDLNRQIYMMKDSGMDVEEIAGRLGIKKGEILLRLGMRK